MTRYCKVNDISYTPKQRSKKPLICITACTAILVACATFMMLELGNALIWQSIFLVAACVLIFFYVRYFSTTYTYTISCETDSFLVVQQKGKTLTTLCNLKLTTLYLVRPYTKEDEADRSSSNRYNYLTTMNPDSSTLLFFDDGERKVSVRIEADEFFYDMLVKAQERNMMLAEEGEI